MLAIAALCIASHGKNGVATGGEEKFENLFIRFDTIHEHDRRRTDRQTPHESIGRVE